MEINRKWAMPNKNTFTIKPIKSLVEKHIDGAKVIIDPFANQCKYGTITNDLNPEYDTTYHLDALEFLKLQDDNSADIVLYAPLLNNTSRTMLLILRKRQTRNQCFKYEILEIV